MGTEFFTSADPAIGGMATQDILHCLSFYAKITQRAYEVLTVVERVRGNLAPHDSDRVSDEGDTIFFFDTREMMVSAISSITGCRYSTFNLNYLTMPNTFIFSKEMDLVEEERKREATIRRIQAELDSAVADRIVVENKILSLQHQLEEAKKQ